jgi:ubiquinone/menaquinone biosynthesis C-methylase UbiE
MDAFENGIPTQFKAPTELPQGEDEAATWQQANKSWWESHPMRYDWRDGIQHEEFSRGFYEDIDRRFFENVREFMPWKRIPFDPLIDFDALASKDVLEIGVGSGSHAALLAKHAKSFTGVDLTEYAIKSTTSRFERFGLEGTLRRMDAEELDFPDNSFDFIWSWGVIHHSSNTDRILKQMHRVLRPGGQSITMVYHRGYWNYYIVGGLFHGILRRDLLKTRSLHKTVQRQTDGAIARYYSIDEWKEQVGRYFEVDDVRIYGSKAEVFPIPGGPVKNRIMAMVPNRITALMTNQGRMGLFLTSIQHKR